MEVGREAGESVLRAKGEVYNYAYSSLLGPRSQDSPGSRLLWVQPWRMPLPDR